MSTVHKVGDRVKRHFRQPGTRKWQEKFGTVTEIYSDYESRFGPCPELYRVRWDDGTESGGYLPHGLLSEGSVK